VVANPAAYRFLEAQWIRITPRSVRLELLPSPCVEGSMSEVVVITGASAGLGRATALRFAKDGASVALLARDEAALQETLTEVQAAGGRGLVIVCDVSDPAQVEAAAERAETELGPIDIWVNNAVASVYMPAQEIKPEEYRRVTEVSYLGQVYGTLAALKRMTPRDRGTIVLVGSGLAYRGAPFHSAYCGSKFALRGFFESLQTELRHDGSNIRLTMVHPSTLNTPFYSWVRTTLPQKPNAVKPVFQPEVAAEAIHWASRHNRRELRLGAPTVAAAYGNGLFPRVTDWLMGKLGYKVETQDEPTPPERPNNLWTPAHGMHATRGEFDAEAKDFSPQLWATTHRQWVGLGAIAVIGAALFGARKVRRR